MTRKEKQKAIDALKKSAPVMTVTQEEFNDYIQILNKVMNWLEQEPCGDLISRQAVLDITWEEPSYTDALNVLTEVRDKVKALPSVKPQEPTGHWEEVSEEYIQVYDLNGIPSCGDERICSECGFETVFIGEHCSQYKFCPSCGAKMVDEQERSE